tara:strand:- start:1892 stop:3199 length:1308 start_codon:yes stop_codon:yes gene_type:complete
MPNYRSGFLTPNTQQPIGNYGQQQQRPGLLGRIGRTLGNLNTGIGNMLSAAGNVYAPPDMNLSQQQKIGLLGSVLGDMSVGPRGERTSNTPNFLNNIRATNELARQRQVMNSPQIQGLLSNVSDPALNALLQEQVASGDVTGGLNNLFNYNRSEEAKRSMIDAARLSGIDPATLQALEGMDAAGIQEYLGDMQTREAAGRDREIDLGIGIYDDFKGDIDPFLEIAPFYDTIRGATANPSAAGDLGMIFAYMKMLDPGSVVREGEFAVAANSGGIPDRIVRQLQQVQSGQRLSPDMRADFARTAQRELENRRARYENSLNLAYARADAMDVNREYVFPSDVSYDLSLGPDGKTLPLEFGVEEGPQDLSAWANEAVSANGNNAAIIVEAREMYPNDPQRALEEATQRIGYPQTLTAEDADFIVNTVERAMSFLEENN